MFKLVDKNGVLMSGNLVHYHYVYGSYDHALRVADRINDRERNGICGIGSLPEMERHDWQVMAVSGSIN